MIHPWGWLNLGYKSLKKTPVFVGFGWWFLRWWGAQQGLQRAGRLELRIDNLISRSVDAELDFVKKILGGTRLGGGFKYFLFSALPGEMIQFDEHIFQRGGSTTN